MEKPGKGFAIAKMWEKQLQKKEILRKEPASLLRFHSGTVFSFFWCKTGFYLSQTSTPNGLFQAFNQLKRLIGYSERFH